MTVVVRYLSVLVWMLLGGCFPLCADGPPPSARIEFFESRIRPVLVEHCYACHNSATEAEGGLAVDHRQAFLDGSDNGKVLVAGQPSASKLIAVLKHEIDGLEMPDGGPKLDGQVIADFERWISMGAADPRDSPPTADEIADVTSWESTLRRRKQWWSFQPIAKPKVPGATIPGETGNPIDRFVRAKLGELELSPAPRADPPTLIRRLWVNLIGLPPTPDEFQHWNARYDQVGDREHVTSDLIDHLLDSAHFGERWARHWMDWIRYAESHGSEGDPVIDNAWMYRDYLIRALNSDVPYDQLVREHVAGDLLEHPRVNEALGINESAIGTAHWRMVFHGFAPTDALDEKVRFVDDQINAFSKAFLGLTVSCARCHDHKFDAISQADYYALFGILGSCRPGRTVIDLPPKQNRNREALAALKPRIRNAIAEDWLDHLPALAERLHTIEGDAKQAQKPKQAQSQRSVLSPLLSLRQESSPEKFKSAWQDYLESWRESRQAFDQSSTIEHWDLASQEDYASWYRHGIGLPARPSKPGEFTISPEGDSAISGIYPAGVYSHALTAKHPARLTSADFKLGENNELWVRVIGDGAASLRYVVQDYPRNGTVYPVTELKPSWKWQTYDMTYWSGDSLHIELAAGKDAPLLVKNQDRSWFGVTDVRLVPKGNQPPQQESEYLAAIVDAGTATPSSPDQLAKLYVTAIDNAIRAWGSDSASDAQADLLDGCLRAGLLPNDVRSLSRAGSLVQRYRQLEAEIPVPTRVPALDETTGRTQPLFVRGNHKQPADDVPRRFLEAIDATPYRTSDSGRLQLAADLLRDDNPLTRRVIVNRVWHHLFGRGIVDTPDNFGRLGSKPTHSELLDWLAIRFVQQDWSLKKLIRTIVSSQTWQQSAYPSSEAKQRDPNNLYLSHANVRRLEAEAIRDSLLAVSGRLDRTQYGRPVQGQANRRSVYVSVIRNSLDPFLRAFDFPEPFSATGRRDVTNVPAQSLTLLNDPQVAEYAAGLARTLLKDAQLTSADARLSRMFVTLFARRPSLQELRTAKVYLESTKQALSDRRRQWEELQTEIKQHRSHVSAIVDPVRTRMTQQAKAGVGEHQTPKPIARWNFDDDFKDSIGNVHGEAHDGARIEAGTLVLMSGGYVTTLPLGRSLTEKTLEAWVSLDDLKQRGGGVMSVQTSNGVVFDSIVFGEREPKRWMAGSNGFQRTKSFDGPAEQEAGKRMVHVAVAYHSDGRIAGYREGKPYGNAYDSDGPVAYNKENVIVSFGVRHLPAGGNRMLEGRIDRAQLYDRALSADEIAATFEGRSFLCF